MKKLLISFAFIIVGLFAVDRLGGMAMWWVNQHTQDVSGGKIKYLVNEVHEDVLLMGTSRCNLHYVPSIISDTLGMSVYNGGIDASENIFSHYLILNHILGIHTPKVICLEVMTNDFAPEEDALQRTTFFAPYFGHNERADSLYLLAGTYWSYKISHLYRFNAKAISNLAGFVVNRVKDEDHGYIPCPQPSRYPASLNYYPTPRKADTLKLQYVQRFINLCHERNIKVVFVVSPMYAIYDANHYDVLKEIARRNNVPFIDYHTAGLYHDHPDYFKDPLHLWDKGARQYSATFAHDLKEIVFAKEVPLKPHNHITK